MPEGAPQQDWFDQNAPPVSTAGPAATAPLVPSTPAASPNAGLNFTSSMTDDQIRQQVNDYLAANGIPNTDNGQYWVDHYHQYGANDPNYLATQLQQAVGRIKGGGGGSLGNLGGNFAQGGAFPGFTPPSDSDFLNSPGLQFGLDQGLGTINKLASAKGVLNSGGTLKALSDYATNYGLTKYGDVFNQGLQTSQQNLGINEANFGNLYSLSNLGMNGILGATA